jgi:dolichyl-phosphate beta-glucosyltransferase
MASRNGVFLSIVIPAYKEESRIGPTLARVRGYLAGKGFASEIIVVDDGSGDRTAAAASEALPAPPAGRLLSRARNKGKGYSVREGVLAARGDWILFSDADLSTPIEELDKFLARRGEGCDVLIGSRALAGSEIQVRQSRLREAMGKAFNVLVRLLVLRGIRDTQCGFKLFRREAGRAVFSRARIDGFGFDVEILRLCRAMGFSVLEIPVVWRDSAPSKVRLVSGSLGMIADLVRIRLRRGRVR